MRIVQNGFGFMAVHNNKIIGFAAADKTPIGEKGEYIEMNLLHVSLPYRNKGIGKQLFSLIKAEAKKQGAEKLYISAADAMESQLFYQSQGCVYARWIYRQRRQEEEFDIQMEYIL